MEKIIVSIKNISWIDKESSEAEVLFQISGKQFWAFCHPCDFNDGEMAEVSFSFIEEEISENAFWTENKEQKREIIALEDDKWRYYCYGLLKSIHPTIIDCGAINLSFGDWINDERVVGSYVYFVISRLDISRIN
jgi:hypothetical protein